LVRTKGDALAQIQLAVTVPELDGIESGHQHRVAASSPCSKGTLRVLPDETALGCALRAALHRMTDRWSWSPV